MERKSLKTKILKLDQRGNQTMDDEATGGSLSFHGIEGCAITRQWPLMFDAATLGHKARINLDSICSSSELSSMRLDTVQLRSVRKIFYLVSDRCRSDGFMSGKG